jgi:hypothetical protein
MRKVFSFMVSTAGWWLRPLGRYGQAQNLRHPEEGACREQRG